MLRDFDSYPRSLDRYAGNKATRRIGLAALIYFGVMLGCGGTAQSTSSGSGEQSSSSPSIQLVDTNFEADCNVQQGYHKAVDENIKIDLTGDGTVDITRSVQTCRKDGAPDDIRQCPYNYNMVEIKTYFEGTTDRLPHEQVEYICVWPGSESDPASGK